ncbi:MAG: AAA family ATPase [Clostridia bacterium]|nr:AAA family ATPase [Clostridia bacterium]
MYIRSVYIESFAALKDKEIEFSQGLNIIEGSNESGKSTVCMFIKFMLYGLSGRTSDGEMSERQKYVPWDTGRAAGNMVIVSGENIYKIERELTVFDDSQPRERLEVIDLLTGAKVMKGEVPGVAILGIPEGLFVNTVFVRQIGGSRVDGEGMTEAIENILLSGDENLSIKKAVDRLERGRKVLMHKRGTGGKIQSALQEEARLASKLEEAKQGNAAMIQYENECARLAALIETRTREKEENTRLYEAYCAIENGRKVLEAREHQEKIDDLSLDLASLEKYGNISEKAGRISALSERLSAVENNLKGLRRFLGDAPDARDSLTGEDRALFEKDVNKAKKAKKGAIVSIVLAIAFAVLTAVLSVPGGVLDLLLLVLLYDNTADSPVGLYVKIGAVAVLSLLAVAFIAFAIVNRTKLSRILKKYSAKNIPDLDDIVKEKIARAAVYEKLSDERKSREADISACEREREGVISSLREAARVFVDDDIKDTDILVSEALDVARDAMRKKEELTAALGMAKGEMRLFADVLGADNGEAALRRMNDAVNTDEGKRAEELDRKSAALVKNKMAFAQNSLPALLSQKGEADATLARLRASTEDSSVIATQLDYTRREIAQMKRSLNAIEAAKNALEKAGEGLKSSLMPRIAKEAEKNLGGFTDGKYRNLSLGSDFSVEMLLDGRRREISYMSAGTADAVYISLRLALAKVLFSGNTPPLVFDESFARVDEKRLSEMLSMLSAGEDLQSLVFTCRTLEGELSEKLAASNKITL